MKLLHDSGNFIGNNLKQPSEILAEKNEISPIVNKVLQDCMREKRIKQANITHQWIAVHCSKDRAVRISNILRGDVSRQS